MSVAVLPPLRQYHQHPESAYVLPADEAEGQRLQAQHTLLEKAYHSGALLPPHVSASLSLSANILDAGTGTGIWALDLASRLPPTIKFTCIDISTRLFPKFPPVNTTFNQASTLDALPEEWKCSFDVVHQRLMVVAFRPAEWRSCLANLYEALKPGGHIILTECGIVDYGPPASATARGWAVAREVMAARGVHYEECAALLPQWLEEAGFVEVHADEQRTDLSGNEDDSKAHRTNIVGVMRGMSGKGVEGLTWKGTEAEYNALMDDVEQEYARTPGLTVKFVWFTARKPEPL